MFTKERFAVSKKKEMNFRQNFGKKIAENKKGLSQIWSKSLNLFGGP